MEEKNEKSKRIRSPNYPALSLPDSLAQLEVAFPKVHRHQTSRVTFVQAMGYRSLNGASATAFSAHVKYGLIEKVAAEDYRVSELGMAILAPHTEGEKKNALKKAAQSPELFSDLFKQFPGNPPSEEVLRSYLVRSGFAINAVGGVVKAFKDTVEYLRGQGISLSGGLSEESEVPTGDSVVKADESRKEEIKEEAMPLSIGEKEIIRGPLSKTSQFRLLVTGEFSAKEVNKLIRILTVQAELLVDDEED